MTKRFKILDGALNYLRTNDAELNPDAPAGTPLKQYQDWKKGARNVTYDRREDSLPESLELVAINPFGEAVADDNKYIIPISNRVLTENTIASLRDAANLIATIPDGASNVKGFIPAKAVIGVPNATLDDPDAESKLTGVPYYKRGIETYTIPYGAIATADREATVRSNILDAIPNDSNYTISFTSEKL